MYLYRIFFLTSCRTGNDIQVIDQTLICCSVICTKNTLCEEKPRCSKRKKMNTNKRTIKIKANRNYGASTKQIMFVIWSSYNGISVDRFRWFSDVKCTMCASLRAHLIQSKIYHTFVTFDHHPFQFCFFFFRILHASRSMLLWSDRFARNIFMLVCVCFVLKKNRLCVSST